MERNGRDVHGPYEEEVDEEELHALRWLHGETVEELIRVAQERISQYLSSYYTCIDPADVHVPGEACLGRLQSGRHVHAYVDHDGSYYAFTDWWVE